VQQAIDNPSEILAKIGHPARPALFGACISNGVQVAQFCQDGAQIGRESP